MIQEFVQQAEQDSLIKFKEINAMVEYNQHRVLQAFKEEQIGDHHFSSTDGYGYDDSGREALEAVYANVFGGEDALVRPQIVSGTHAISTTLFALLRPEIGRASCREREWISGVGGAFNRKDDVPAETRGTKASRATEGA